jgi:hypothetical protein
MPGDFVGRATDRHQEEYLSSKWRSPGALIAPLLSGAEYLATVQAHIREPRQTFILSVPFTLLDAASGFPAFRTPSNGSEPAGCSGRYATWSDAGWE